jgi:hypothetical protein
MCYSIPSNRCPSKPLSIWLPKHKKQCPRLSTVAGNSVCAWIPLRQIRKKTISRRKPGKLQGSAHVIRRNCPQFFLVSAPSVGFSYSRRTTQSNSIGGEGQCNEHWSVIGGGIGGQGTDRRVRILLWFSFHSYIMTLRPPLASLSSQRWAGCV